jgi:hypothetical protein
MWDPVELKNDVVYRCDIGGISFFIKHFENDWYVASTIRDRDSGVHPLAPVKASARPGIRPKWNRWISGEEALVVRLVPALPERPLVVKPEFTIKVPISRSAVFYVSIPIWIRIMAGDDRTGGPSLMLTEIPTAILSKTWFGDTVSGELCYALTTHAERDLSDLKPVPHEAICPLSIRNSSQFELNFQRLCLHAENLSVFKAGERLWTSVVNVDFRGEEQMSQIRIVDRPPDQAGQDCPKICDARVKPDRSLMKKSFQMLRFLTGMEE